MKVVFTGGPCAGKSTIINLLTGVIKVPEVATTLMKIGITPERNGVKDFQKSVFEYQLMLESEYSLFKTPHVIYDRGLIDGEVFWPEGSEDFYSSMKFEKDELLRRYDVVIHLTSLAVSEPSNYGYNNPHRTETITEAITQDNLLWDAYKDHPLHYRVSGTKEEVLTTVKRILQWS